MSDYELRMSVSWKLKILAAQEKNAKRAAELEDLADEVEAIEAGYKTEGRPLSTLLARHVSLSFCVATLHLVQNGEASLGQAAEQLEGAVARVQDEMKYLVRHEVEMRRDK